MVLDDAGERRPVRLCRRRRRAFDTRVRLHGDAAAGARAEGDDGADLVPASRSPAAEAHAAPDEFNVENFFPPSATDDGHTYTEAEYEAKRDAIADAIDGFLKRPDVIGMQEVAYLPGRLNQLQDLAHILGGYRAFVLQSNDARGIAPAFLIKKGVGVKVSDLRQYGRAEQYDGPGGMFACGDNPGETQLFNRPPLALDIRDGGLSFTYITNHWASQSHPEPCREAEASFLHGVVGSLENAGDNVIVGGDLNDFEDSPRSRIWWRRARL